MINLKETTKDKLVLLLPILWVLMIVFVYLGLGYTGMYLTVIHAMISAALGLAEGEKVNKKLFIIFVIGWGILTMLAITGMIYYYDLFGNTNPNFLILGMHPSAFFFYGAYWLGQFIYLGVFFYALRDVWLPQEKWDAFAEYALTLTETEKR